MKNSPENQNHRSATSRPKPITGRDIRAIHSGTWISVEDRLPLDGQQVYVYDVPGGKLVSVRFQHLAPVASTWPGVTVEHPELGWPVSGPVFYWMAVPSRAERSRPESE